MHKNGKLRELEGGDQYHTGFLGILRIRVGILATVVIPISQPGVYMKAAWVPFRSQLRDIPGASN